MSVKYIHIVKRIGIFKFSFYKLRKKWSLRLEFSSDNWSTNEESINERTEDTRSGRTF